MLSTGIPIALFALVALTGCDSDRTMDIVSPGTDSPVSPKLGLPGLEVDPTFNPLDEDRIDEGVFGVTNGIVTTDSGGTLLISESTLEIPAGAVPGNMLVGWAMVDQAPTDLGDPLPRTYIFAPHGIHFLVPVRLYVSFNDAGLFQKNPHSYSMYYYDESTGLWEKVDTRVNLATQQFVVTLNHFSRYAFGRTAAE